MIHFTIGRDARGDAAHERKAWDLNPHGPVGRTV